MVFHYASCQTYFTVGKKKSRYWRKQNLWCKVHNREKQEVTRDVASTQRMFASVTPVVLNYMHIFISMWLSSVLRQPTTHFCIRGFEALPDEVWLLTGNAVLIHGHFISDEEMTMIHENTRSNSGIFSVQKDKMNNSELADGTMHVHSMISLFSKRLLCWLHHCMEMKI